MVHILTRQRAAASTRSPVPRWEAGTKGQRASEEEPSHREDRAGLCQVTSASVTDKVSCSNQVKESQDIGLGTLQLSDDRCFLS